MSFRFKGKVLKQPISPNARVPSSSPIVGGKHGHTHKGNGGNDNLVGVGGNSVVGGNGFSSNCVGGSNSVGGDGVGGNGIGGGGDAGDVGDGVDGGTYETVNDKIQILDNDGYLLPTQKRCFPVEDGERVISNANIPHRTAVVYDIAGVTAGDRTYEQIDNDDDDDDDDNNTNDKDNNNNNNNNNNTTTNNDDDAMMSGQSNAYMSTHVGGSDVDDRGVPCTPQSVLKDTEC